MVCTLLGTSVFAQDTLDFIDPLATERVRIEERDAAPARPADTRELPPSRLGSPPEAERSDDSVLIRARDGAAVSAGVLRDEASGFWSTLRNGVASVATALGLSVLGLVALLLLLTLGIALLVGWTLFRGRRRYRAERPVDDVYAYSSKDAARRRASAPRAAAAQDPDFEETMPEDFDAIFAEENDPPARHPAPARAGGSDTRRKPNLDRLRDSIKADWKAAKAEKTGKAKRADTSPRPAPVAAAPAPASAPHAPPAATDDPAMRRLDDLSDGWEDWDAQNKPEDDLWGETLPVADTAGDDGDGEESATTRIRALRESLRAS